MGFPFGITWGEITIVGLLTGIITIGASKLWDKRQARIEARRERVHEWHQEMQEHFSEVILVGRRIQVRERQGADLDVVEELIPVASKLEALVNTPPSGLRRMVDEQVFIDARAAAGLVYHFVRLPAPEQDADSIAGVIRHQYELLDLLDSNTGVEMRKVLGYIGEIAQPEEIDISEEEAERILTRFEEEADRRMEDAQEMTVDELMQLPWKDVDRVVSNEARRELLQFSVEQYYDKALLEIPKKARKLLDDSQDELFE
jgi:hypothetical protein